jgi:hypothetical protein
MTRKPPTPFQAVRDYKRKEQAKNAPKKRRRKKPKVAAESQYQLELERKGQLRFAGM